MSVRPSVCLLFYVCVAGHDLWDPGGGGPIPPLESAENRLVSHSLRQREIGLEDILDVQFRIRICIVYAQGQFEASIWPHSNP